MRVVHEDAPRHRPTATTAMLCTFALAFTAGLTAASRAGAADAVVDAGPLASPPTEGYEDTPPLGAGHGWLVWPHRDPDGQISLMASRSGGPPKRLEVARLGVVRSIDVGRGPRGSAAAVYRGCRAGRCGIMRLDLQSGRETRVGIPVPRGCRLGPIALDRRVFFLAYPTRGDDRCRGIYEVIRRRAVLRLATGFYAYDLAVDKGEIAFAGLDARDVVQIKVQRRGARRPRVIHEDDGIQNEAATTYRLTWDGGLLWMGRFTSTADGEYASVMRVRFAPLRCAFDKTSFERSFGGIGFPSAWAFTERRIYYAAREPDGSFSLRQRTDPPPAFSTASCYRV